MKIRKLFLKAFGSFSGKELDFGDGTANLHLIFGANEAGKSSALRAMTDLRFGIPQQSRDNFVHGHKDMAIAGTFIDATGNEISLHRRKGRQNTLSAADRETGDAMPDTPVDTQTSMLLTGGFDRQQFESMFGLDHQRLRDGGKALISGDGEVGSSLFEASSGTANVKGLLATLKEDVKKYHSPRGHSALLNAARKRLDEQKKLLKDNLTRPKVWKDLDRAHQKTKADLADIQQNLSDLRKTEADLTELRTVHPLLKQHDDTAQDLEAFANVQLLAEDSRERRAKAEQALHSALENEGAARQTLDECDEKSTTLLIESALLNHSAVLDRLLADAEAVRRSQDTQADLTDKVEHLKEQLAASAKRISSSASIDALLDAIPNAADKATIREQLERIKELELQLGAYLENVQNLEQKLSLNPEEYSETLPEQRKAVENALRQAQGMGDVSRVLEDLSSRVASTRATLRNSLRDLGIDSIESVSTSRPLMPSEIDATDKALAAIEETLNNQNKESSRLEEDLSAQKIRLLDLKAEGEFATTKTLAEAREQRDSGWTLIKQAYVQGQSPPDLVMVDYDADAPLPQAFESAMVKADTQADLLRANAERAAKVSECEIRISQMTDAMTELSTKTQESVRQRSGMLTDWNASLTQACLPNYNPSALREWLVLRKNCLDVNDDLLATEKRHADLLSKVKECAATLAARLAEAGEPPCNDGKDLPLLITQAQDWIAVIIRRDAQREADKKTITTLKKDRETFLERIDDRNSSLKECRNLLGQWHTRLMLPDDCSPSALSARLIELDAFAAESRELDRLKVQLKAGMTASQRLEADAREIAALLGDPAFTHTMDYIDRLASRLEQSRDNQRQQDELYRRRKEASSNKAKAEAAINAANETLRTLCTSASVSDASGLPEAEDRSTQKRRLQDQLAQLASQLRQTSSSSDDLRLRLADKSAVDLDEAKRQCAEYIRTAQAALEQKQEDEQSARRALEEIDDSGRAAEALESMESALADYRAALKPWAQLKLAESLLESALVRFKDRAQAPMMQKASEYFRLATGSRYSRLLVNDEEDTPQLMAERNDGSAIGIDGMSEGTADQLFLALRLAALDLQSNDQMPLILDDVLITSDDERSTNILKALSLFSERRQVMLFTHHNHLVELARQNLGEATLATHTLQ